MSQTVRQAMSIDAPTVLSASSTMLAGLEDGHPLWDAASLLDKIQSSTGTRSESRRPPAAAHVLLGLAAIALLLSLLSLWAIIAAAALFVAGLRLLPDDEEGVLEDGKYDEYVMHERAFRTELRREVTREGHRVLGDSVQTFTLPVGTLLVGPHGFLLLELGRDRLTVVPGTAFHRADISSTTEAMSEEVVQAHSDVGVRTRRERRTTVRHTIEVTLRTGNLRLSTDQDEQLARDVCLSLQGIVSR